MLEKRTRLLKERSVKIFNLNHGEQNMGKNEKKGIRNIETQ